MKKPNLLLEKHRGLCGQGAGIEVRGWEERDQKGLLVAMASSPQGHSVG